MIYLGAVHRAVDGSIDATREFTRKALTEKQRSPRRVARNSSAKMTCDPLQLKDFNCDEGSFTESRGGR